jgi:hypothetical protein
MEDWTQNIRVWCRRLELEQPTDTQYKAIHDELTRMGHVAGGRRAALVVVASRYLKLLGMEEARHRFAPVVADIVYEICYDHKQFNILREVTLRLTRDIPIPPWPYDTVKLVDTINKFVSSRTGEKSRPNIVNCILMNLHKQRG